MIVFSPKNLFLNIVFLALFIGSGFSQTEEQMKELKKGDQSYSKGDYGEALRSYLPLLEVFDEKTLIQYSLNFKVGFCYYASAPEDSFAVPFLTKYLETADVHFEAYYFLGQISLSHHNFDNAIEQFEKFKGFVINNTDLNNSGLSEQILEIADNNITKCKLGKSFSTHPREAIVENITGGVNTEYSEYAPVISPDETQFLFTRRSPETLGGRVSDDGDFYEDIYLSKLTRMSVPAETDSFGNPIGTTMVETDVFSRPVNMGGSVNTEGHEGAIHFSADGKKLFVYRNSNILVSSLNKKNKWQKAIKQSQMKKVLKKGVYEPSLCITPDGNRIYFSSERVGGMGGLDIYMSEKGSDGKWAEAVNLGNNINSRYDEDAPHVSHDGQKLYFSSKGHKGMGDYDIFVSDFVGGDWSKPVNMGYPINSANNDIFYTVSPITGIGYFSSDRTGGTGLMDIYKATFSSNAPASAKISGKVIGTDSLPCSVQLFFIDSLKPLDSNIVNSDASAGAFLKEVEFGKTYYINIWDKSFEKHSDTVYVPELGYYGQQFSTNLNIILQKTKLDTAVKTDTTQNQLVENNLPTFQKNEEKIDTTDKTKLTETLKKILNTEKNATADKILPITPGLFFKVQIGAFKKPLSKNIYENVNDLAVVSFEDGFTCYFSGNYSSLADAKLRKSELLKDGFSDAFIVAFKDGKRIYLDGPVRP